MDGEQYERLADHASDVASFECRSQFLSNRAAPTGIAGNKSDFSSDPVAKALDQALRVALGRRETASQPFVERLRDTIEIYQSHAASRAAPRPVWRQGLAGWQEQKAKQLLVANIDDRIPIQEVAAACKLSRNYFIKSFKLATGETPNRWLRQYRVEKAKTLLLGSLSIAEIAVECGFSDQSHLTRIFASFVGIPPGAWRHERRQTDPVAEYMAIA